MKGCLMSDVSAKKSDCGKNRTAVAFVHLHDLPTKMFSEAGPVLQDTPGTKRKDIELRKLDPTGN